jgi:hypothetical protein
MQYVTTSNLHIPYREFHTLQKKKTPLSRGNASGLPNFPNFSFSFKDNWQVLQLEDRKNSLL